MHPDDPDDVRVDGIALASVREPGSDALLLLGLLLYLARRAHEGERADV